MFISMLPTVSHVYVPSRFCSKQVLCKNVHIPGNFTGMCDISLPSGSLHTTEIRYGGSLGTDLMCLCSVENIKVMVKKITLPGLDLPCTLSYVPFWH